MSGMLPTKKVRRLFAVLLCVIVLQPVNVVAQKYNYKRLCL